MCGVVKILKDYELSSTVVKKAFDQISRWQKDHVVVLTGGEPFLRKDIFELIDYAVKKHVTVEVVSNGALINETLAKKIVSSGLKNIAISLDGAQVSTHDFIREKGSFKSALRALENLVQAKKRLNYGPQISVWTTIMKENVKELSGVIPLVKNLGVECLVYHPVIVSQDDMQITSHDAPFWIREDDLVVLREQLDAITDYQKKHGLVAFLHDPYLWLNYFQGTLMKKNWKCNPFVFINIGPDGEVRSCGASFGNLKEMSLNECLLTEEAHQARKIMKTCSKPCLQTCWAHPPSDSLTDIANNFLATLNTSKVPNTKKILKEAMYLLDEYQGMLNNHV
jgi:MoaA/NifB/PqqE/SkfB family radical SAM enzyme